MTWAVAIVVASLVACDSAAATGAHWTMSVVNGAAMLLGPDDVGQVARPGAPIPSGTTLVTGDDGMVTLSRRGDRITVHPNSEMTIEVEAAGDGPAVMQSYGRLQVRLDNAGSRDLRIRTPYLAASVQGTLFTVVVSRTDASLSVVDGLARVATRSGAQTLTVQQGWSAVARIESGVVELGIGRTGDGGALAEAGQLAPPEPVGEQPSATGSSAGEAAPGGSSGRGASGDKSSRDKSSRDNSSRDKGSRDKDSRGNDNGKGRSK